MSNPVGLADPVGEEMQRAPRCRGGIELSHRAGCRVARIDEKLLAAARILAAFSASKSRRVM